MISLELTEAILAMLGANPVWHTTGDYTGTPEQESMPTVQPLLAGLGRDQQTAVMGALLRAGLVGGCDDGCRGDWHLTCTGEEWLLDTGRYHRIRDDDRWMHDEFWSDRILPGAPAW